MDEAGRRIGRLAKGPLLARLLGGRKEPLKLVAVPRDHVAGDKQRGAALLAGRFHHGTDELALADLDIAALGAETPTARALQGFGWLRDLAAAAGREAGAAVAEPLVGRWLVAHGDKPDAAWEPALWGERLLFWTAYAPYILSSRDAAYRSALLNTMARGARHTAAAIDKVEPGLPRITAAAGALAAALTLQGLGAGLARAEAALLRALSAGQFDDGGLISRSPDEQMLLVDRLGLVRAAYFAAKQTLPDTLESAAAAALAALHGVIMGDNRLSSWQGGNPHPAARVTALVEGCGLRARPLRVPRGWGYHRLSALGTVVVIDAAPPPPARFAGRASASTLGIEVSDGAQRLVVNCGGPGREPGVLPDELADALRSTAAHSVLVVADTNSTAIQPDGALGKGVAEVRVERAEDNDSSRLEAGHDGYVRAFGLVHDRVLVLGNDGKDLSGEDRLVPRGRRRIKAPVPVAIRFHLAPGVEPTLTADGQGALLRSAGAPPWNFRVSGAALSIEDSLAIDGHGRALATLQLVATAEASGVGATVQWQLRRSS